MERNNSFLNKRPNVTIDTATTPTRSPVHHEGTPRSVADTATPQLRQESNYSCFSMATPTIKATPLTNGRWADEGEEVSVWETAKATPEIEARQATEVFEESEPVAVHEMQRVGSESSLASAASHVSFVYRHNPYNITLGKDELHRCDCDQCSNATTPRHLADEKADISSNSNENFMPFNSEAESPSSRGASAFPSFNGSSASLRQNSTPALNEQNWDRSLSDAIEFGPQFSEESPVGSYDATSMTAQQLAMPIAPQAQLLKAWVPPPPPPRITGRILSDGKPDVAVRTDAVLSNILQRWYFKVTQMQHQFVSETQCCPEPNAFESLDSWVAAIGSWWHRHFEDSQKKIRVERAHPSAPQHNGFSSHTTAVPQPRSVAARIHSRQAQRV